MSQNMQTLLAIAADLRSGGASWDAVASQVGRQTSTCQQWPSRFRQDWLPLYHAAQQRRLDEAGAEALHLLRLHMRASDAKTSLRSIELLLRYGQRAATALPATPPPPPRPAEANPSGEGALSPEDRDWLAIGRYFGEERQRSDAERAAQGLPPTTDNEFYGAYLREFQSINTPPIEPNTEPNAAAPEPPADGAAPARSVVPGLLIGVVLFVAGALTIHVTRLAPRMTPTETTVVAAAPSTANRADRTVPIPLQARAFLAPSPPEAGGEGWGEGGCSPPLPAPPPHPDPLPRSGGEGARMVDVADSALPTIDRLPCLPLTVTMLTTPFVFSGKSLQPSVPPLRLASTAWHPARNHIPTRRLFMNDLLTRRLFLQGGSAAALGYFFTAHAVSAARAADNPNEKVRIAGIGVGGKGSSDIDHCWLVKDGMVVAICDIDEDTLNKKANQKGLNGGKKGDTTQYFLEAKKFVDYRKMLDELGKEIDAVTVSTPDHTHAPASLLAMRLKKHVYTQKPLTHTVYEARLMRDTAKKYGVCSQMGNQGTAANGLRRAAEIVQAGLLGKVTEVHVWTNRPIWPQGSEAILKIPAARQAALAALWKKEAGSLSYEAPPKHVHWDLFLGTAPERPYYPGIHPFAWRGWWDYGTGALGDMACHTANMAFMALKLGHPTSIEAKDVIDLNPETYPTQAHVIFQFPARGDMAPLTLHWYEGQYRGRKMLPPPELIKKVLKSGDRLADSGSILVGDKGTLFSPDDYGAAYRLTPEEAFKDLNTSKPENLPVNARGDVGMKQEWVDAMRASKPEIALSNFDYAGMLTETILLGNIAIRFAEKKVKLAWDGPNMKFTNSREANAFVKGEYRKGWEIDPAV